MFPSIAFIAIFTVTGLRSLVRLFARPAGGDRTAETSHLLMSVAMAGMAWGWPTGSDTAVVAAQLVVFGVLAVVFVVRLLESAERPQAGSVHHLLTSGAMLWMVLATPAAHGKGHAAAAPAVTQLVTLAFVVLLCASVVALVPRRAPVLVAAAAPATRTGSRLDVTGHVVMSGGMAAMLVAGHGVSTL